MKLPSGRFGSCRPARARRMALATARDGLVLADHALVQPLFHVDELLHFAFHQPRDRDVRPARRRPRRCLLRRPASLSIRGARRRRRPPASCSRICRSSSGMPAVLQLRRLARSRRPAAPARSPGAAARALPSARGRPEWPPSPAATARPGRVRVLLEIGELLARARSSRSCEALSDSLRSASRSISSCMMRRSTSSSSAGIESISMRSRDAASSMRSMALSGRNRSAM